MKLLLTALEVRGMFRWSKWQKKSVDSSFPKSIHAILLEKKQQIVKRSRIERLSLQQAVNKVRNTMDILIIEDEKNVRNELKQLLENAFYNVAVVEKFEQVVEQILAISPDLVLLDLKLPGQDGQMICRALRQTSTVPVIFLTSDSDVMTELDCILLGGDDFITKPYAPSLLLARIQAVLKRTINQPTEQFVLTHKGVSLNISTYKVYVEETEAELTKTEFKLLHYLFQRKGEVVPRMDIIVYLWDNDVFIDDNALSVNMTRLRNKLDTLGISDFIQTKRGVGYQL